MSLKGRESMAPDAEVIAMGLAVEVGMLADLLEIDAEGADWLRESFDSVNAVLAEHKLPPIQLTSRSPMFACR